MKRHQIISILAAATALLGCSNTSKTQFIPLPVLDLVPITQAEVIPSSRFSGTTETLLGGDFDFDAFKALRSRQSICLSPFSLGAALSMAAEGASGATADQMWKVLGKEYSKAPEASTVKVANSVWVNKHSSGFQENHPEQIQLRSLQQGFQPEVCSCGHQQVVLPQHKRENPVNIGQDGTGTPADAPERRLLL